MFSDNIYFKYYLFLATFNGQAKSLTKFEPSISAFIFRRSISFAFLSFLLCNFSYVFRANSQSIANNHSTTKKSVMKK